MRAHFKQKKKFALMKKSNIIILLVILIMMGVISLFYYSDKKITPVIMEYAKNQAGRIATLVINQAITSEIADKINLDDLFINSKDNNGNIVSIDFNPIAVNKMLSMVTSSVEEYLRNLEDGNVEELGLSNSVLSHYNINKLKQGIIYEVPTGVVFSNSILYNLGPKVPVRLSLIGDIVSNIETKVTNYGINNALVEVIIHISVVEQVMLPVSTNKITVSTNVPVAMKLVQGVVPNYYASGATNSRTFTVPLEQN